MEQVLIGILCTVIIAWMGWVSLTIVRNYNNSTDTSELKSAFNEMKKDIKEEIDKVNARQDLFMQREIEELKSLLKKG